MKIDLLYGKGGLSVQLPDNTQVVRKKGMPILDDPQGSLRRGLHDPIGTPSLREIAEGKSSVCIVVCDITRPVPNGVILPVLLEELHAAGIKKDQITILIATGNHRPNLGPEMVEVIGRDEMVKNYRVVNHSSTASEELEYLGKTPNDTPVYINKIYTRSDLRVLTGLVEPHFMAGYSGGRKCICPGVAAAETVKYLHSPRYLESPYATNCITAGNPLHEELLNIARMAGCEFSINAVIDDKRNISGFFCGDIEKAHEVSVEFSSRYVTAGLPEKADIIVTTSAGYPLDKTYYQAVKGLVGVLGVLKEGGTIIMAAECSEGLGSDNFIKCLDDLATHPDYDSYIAKISDLRNFVIDQWEVEMLIKALRVGDVMLYTDKMDRDSLQRTFAQPVESVEDGIKASLKKHGRGAKMVAIPEGPYVIPYVKV